MKRYVLLLMLVCATHSLAAPLIDPFAQTFKTTGCADYGEVSSFSLERRQEADLSMAGEYANACALMMATGQILTVHRQKDEYTFQLVSPHTAYSGTALARATVNLAALPLSPTLHHLQLHDIRAITWLRRALNDLVQRLDQGNRNPDSQRYTEVVVLFGADLYSTLPVPLNQPYTLPESMAIVVSYEPPQRRVIDDRWSDQHRLWQNEPLILPAWDPLHYQHHWYQGKGCRHGYGGYECLNLDEPNTSYGDPFGGASTGYGGGPSVDICDASGSLDDGGGSGGDE